MVVAQAYNGGLGVEPPAGSRAEPLVRGSEGKAEAESILVFGAEFLLKYLVFLNTFIVFTCCFKEEFGHIGLCI